MHSVSTLCANDEDCYDNFFFNEILRSALSYINTANAGQ